MRESKAISLAPIACLLALLLPACSGDEELVVVLDPEYRLLRDDLREIARPTSALTLAGPAWGRAGWTAEAGAPAERWGLDRTHGGLVPRPVPLDDTPEPAPYTLSGAEIELEILPIPRTLAGSAAITITVGESALDRLRLLLDARSLVRVEAVNPGVATFDFTGRVLTVVPIAPVAPGVSWTVEVAWTDAEVEHYQEAFSEGGGRALANLVDPVSSFFTYGYYYWPRPADVLELNHLGFRVTYPAGRTLAMTGERLERLDNGDGTMTDSWRVDSPLRSAAALALAEYELAESHCGPAAIEVLGIPGRSIDDYPIVPATYTSIIATLCNELRSRFGDPAPTTIRLVGVDERFTNGYSTPGLILVPNYVWDDDGSHTSFIERDFYLAHELAHQWWGDAVFIDAARDLWLIEGMADYAAANALERTQGEAVGQWVWLWEVQELLAYYSNGGSDHPLVPEDDSAMELRIPYIKGAWVLRMMETVVGVEALEAGLRALVSEHPFQAITSDDLVVEISARVADDPGWFFEQWLFGTGLLSLRESHQENGDALTVTVEQLQPWAADPVRYFRMPLQVVARRGALETQGDLALEGGSQSLEIPAPRP